MKPFFEDLFVFTHQHNLGLIQALSEHKGKLPEKSFTVFSHMLNAHQVWNNRIVQAAAPFGVWQVHPPEDYLAIANNNYGVTKNIITAYDFNQLISYANTKGDAFTNTVQDILFQIINHSTYHRGQLAAQFREAGLEPLHTEYISYKR